MPSKSVRTKLIDRMTEFLLYRLVLRIVTDDSNAVCRFSMKFGADMNTARRLIDKAQEIGQEVIGVR